MGYVELVRFTNSVVFSELGEIRNHEIANVIVKQDNNLKKMFDAMHFIDYMNRSITTKKIEIFVLLTNIP